MAKRHVDLRAGRAALQQPFVYIFEWCLGCLGHGPKSAIVLGRWLGKVSGAYGDVWAGTMCVLACLCIGGWDERSGGFTVALLDNVLSTGTLPGTVPPPVEAIRRGPGRWPLPCPSRAAASSKVFRVEDSEPQRPLPWLRHRTSQVWPVCRRLNQAAACGPPRSESRRGQPCPPRKITDPRPATDSNATDSKSTR